MEQRRSRNFKICAKAVAYSGIITLMTVGMACATLDQQITRATDIVLGNLASLVVGGGTAIGGGIAVFQGNIMKAMGIVGVGATIGIGIALAKNKTIFNLLA